MGKTAQKKQVSPENPSDKFLDKFWDSLFESQQKIDRQIEESDKKYQKKQEAKKLLLEESEKKFIRQMEEKNRLLRESEEKFRRNLEKSNRQITESSDRYQQKLEKNRIKYYEDTEEIKKSEKTGENKKSGGLLRKIEQMFGKKTGQAGEICSQFREIGFVFNEISGNHKILDETGNVKTETDIILENIHCLMVIQICANLKDSEIENHINRLLILREHRDRFNDKRKIYGALLVKKINITEIKKILENGIFVIEQDSGSIKINVPEIMPREW